MRESGIQPDAPSCTVNPASQGPKDHPLRPLRTMVDPEFRSGLHTLPVDSGHDSIPPQKPLRVPLLTAFHSIRSERWLMEPMGKKLLRRRFVDISTGMPNALTSLDLHQEQRPFSR